MNATTESELNRLRYLAWMCFSIPPSRFCEAEIRERLRTVDAAVIARYVGMRGHS